MIVDMGGADWLIWSHEHGGWLGPESRGYTTDVREAGRYTLEEGLRVCRGANSYKKVGAAPNEVLTPAPKALAEAEAYYLTGEPRE